MAKTNLSLGNLFRATKGTARSTETSSMNNNNGGGSTQVSLSDFAVDSVTHNHVFTYVVEGTSETFTTTFGSAGTRHSARVAGVANNYTVTTSDAAQFTITATPPNFSINAQAVTSGAYAGQSAGCTISATYADGFNTNATGYNVASTKTIYVVDTYNSINDVYCVSTDTQIQLADGSLVDAGDVYVGDKLLAYVPTTLPDETDTFNPWIWWNENQLAGNTQEVVVRNVFFNFVDKFYNINDGLLKVTETHPTLCLDEPSGVYKFKQAMDIRVGDKLVKYNTTTNEIEEIVVTSNVLVPTSIEVVTIDVEQADVYLANGFISHNKGSNSIIPIPNANLRMYLHPQYSQSVGVNSTDWTDLSGFRTGFRQIAAPTRNTGSIFTWNLNGSTQYFTKPARGSADNLQSGSVEFDVSAFTLIMWIKTPSTLGTATLFSKTNGSSKDFELAMTSTALQMNSSVFGNVSVTHGLTTSTYNMLAVTLSGTTTKFYKNGTQVGTDQTTTAGTANNAYPLYIGGGVGTYFNSEIGEVIYYAGSALTAQNIADIYANTKGSYGL